MVKISKVDFIECIRGENLGTAINKYLTDTENRLIDVKIVTPDSALLLVSTDLNA